MSIFDFGGAELLVIAIVALIVIGPKELPGLLRQVGKFVGKMRSMAGDFQQQFSEAMRDSELEEIKKDMKKVAEDARVDIDYDMVDKTDREIREALENQPVTASAKGAPAQKPVDPDNVMDEIEIPREPAKGAAPAATGTGPVTPEAAQPANDAAAPPSKKANEA